MQEGEQKRGNAEQTKSSKADLVAALKAYRGKQRSHGTMYAQASSLSDQDMQDVAAYLARVPLPSSAPRAPGR